MGIRPYQGKTGRTYQWRFKHNGKLHTGTFDTDSKTEAEELFTLKKREIRRGIKIDSEAESKPEKADLLSTFIDDHPRPRHAKDAHVVAAIKEFFAGRSLQEITAEDCKRFRQWRLDRDVLPQKEGGKTRVRKPRTVNREFSVLSSYFTLAVEQGRLAHNPCHDVPALEFAVRQPQIWTREQAKRAIAWMVDEREHLLPLVLVALQTGLSRKDLFHLRAGEVQIEGNTGVLTKQRSKTGAAINLPLNSVAIQVLRPLVTGKRSDAFVFINRHTGKPFVNITKSLDTACRLARVPRVTWHRLRHSVGTWLAEDGAGIEVIARFLAHSDYRTAPVYVQLAAEKVRPQAEALGAWVNNNTNPDFQEGKKSVETENRVLRLVTGK